MDGIQKPQPFDSPRQSSGQAAQGKQEKDALQDSGEKLEKGGKTAQRAGAAMQTGGKTLEMGGKAAEVGGKGLQAGGKALEGTRVGAAASAPAEAAGTALRAGGKGAQTVGKGASRAGQKATAYGTAGKQAGSHIQKISDHLLKRGITADQKELERLSKDRPRRPDFPILLTMLAGTKDLIDFLSLGFLGIITNIIITPIILWVLMGKVGFVKRGAWRWFIGVTVLEFTPWLSFFPFWTFFIVRAHLTEYEKIDQMLNTFEQYLEKAT